MESENQKPNQVFIFIYALGIALIALAFVFWTFFLHSIWDKRITVLDTEPDRDIRGEWLDQLSVLKFRQQAIDLLGAESYDFFSYIASMPFDELGWLLPGVFIFPLIVTFLEVRNKRFLIHLLAAGVIATGSFASLYIPYPLVKAWYPYSLLLVLGFSVTCFMSDTIFFTMLYRLKSTSKKDKTRIAAGLMQTIPTFIFVFNYIKTRFFLLVQLMKRIFIACGLRPLAAGLGGVLSLKRNPIFLFVYFFIMAAMILIYMHLVFFSFTLVTYRFDVDDLVEGKVINTVWHDFFSYVEVHVYQIHWLLGMFIFSLMITLIAVRDKKISLYFTTYFVIFTGIYSFTALVLENFLLLLISNWLLATGLIAGHVLIFAITLGVYTKLLPKIHWASPLNLVTISLTLLGIITAGVYLHFETFALV